MSASASLTDALLELVNEREYAARKEVVERHRGHLLGDDADAVLETAVANNAGRPEVQARFALCRTILADCRAIGIDAAFILSTGPTPGLLEAVKELLGAESGTAAHDATIRHRALLLTDEADWVLAALAHEVPEERFFVARVAHRRELLGRCRSDGIDPAFDELLREDRTTAALNALLPVIGSPDEAAIVLGRYEDVLLGDSAARSVGNLASRQDLSPDVARAFAGMRSLLDIARVDGPSTAIATYLLPPFEQFLSRCFQTITTDGDDPGRGIGRLKRLWDEYGKGGDAFAEALRRWAESVIETATHVGLQTCRVAVTRLGMAFEGLSEEGVARSEEAATACVQTSNRFLQRVFVLRQEQARVERVFATVDEAVAAARRLQAQDGFDLFRGQRCAWPVVSSFRRLDRKQQADAAARVNRFIDWSKTEAALAQYAFSSDQAIAVAQHYGIATTFLDVTTDIEVARYFAIEHCLEATDRQAADQAEPSCIVAIRSAHLEAWLKERFRQTDQFLGPEILRLDVPNLWRLEAQAGMFLVDDEIIDDYPFHCLLFPASAGPEPSRTRSAVYPEKKSDLELMLEQWFWHEGASAGMHRLLELLDQGAVAPRRLESEPTDGIGLKGILRPAVHPSWAGREKTWSRATERLDTVLPRPGDTFRVELRSGMDLRDLHRLVETSMPLDSLADRRIRSADWHVFVDDAIDPESAAKLARQWDALRIDGYSDAQIVASFTRSIALLALQLGCVAGRPGFKLYLGVGEDPEPLTSLFGGDLLVEFTGLVGYSRGLVSAADLRSAVRDDIDRHLPADLYDGCGPTAAERMHRLLHGIHRPNLLFDFTRFSDVYIRQVVPTSVVLRPKLPLYPVLHLQTFGVP